MPAVPLTTTAAKADAARPPIVTTTVTHTNLPSTPTARGATGTMRVESTETLQATQTGQTREIRGW